MGAVEREKNVDWLHHKLNWVKTILGCVCVFYVVLVSNHVFCTFTVSYSSEKENTDYKTKCI